MKQPFLGLAALALAIGLSMLVISLFTEQTLNSWAGFCLMICVPAQLIVVLAWEGAYPKAIARLEQPLRGIGFTALMALISAIVGFVAWKVVGGSQAPSAPLIHYTIFCILLTFWYVALWGAWPVSSLTSNPAMVGLSVVVVAFGLGYVLFDGLFNFSFLEAAPDYDAALDPKGPLNAWDVVVPAMTSLSFILVLGPLFEGWPVREWPTSKTRAGYVAGASVYVVVLASLLYWLATSLLAFDQIEFMMYGMVTFVFGVFVPTAFFRDYFCAGWSQPAKGLALTAIAAASGFLLQRFYLMAAPTLTGPMPGGPEGAYRIELWLATALLGVTFPVLTVLVDFFGCWPLARREPS